MSSTSSFLTPLKRHFFFKDCSLHIAANRRSPRYKYKNNAFCIYIRSISSMLVIIVIISTKKRSYNCDYFSVIGLLGLDYLNLSIDITSCETIWESLYIRLMTRR